MVVNSRKQDRPARPYRSQLRRQQAAETRRRVVEAAAVLFERQGYRATTFAQLASEADVSVKTVQEYGPKAALLQAAVELTSFGVEGETDVFATDLGRAVLQVETADELATVIGAGMTAVNAPTAGLWTTLVSAAHADTELGAFHARMLGMVRAQVENVLRHVDERGWLRHDIPFDDLVESVCVTTSVETYVRFVGHDGLSVDRYESFVSRTVRETVLAR